MQQVAVECLLLTRKNDIIIESCLAELKSRISWPKIYMNSGIFRSLENNIEFKKILKEHLKSFRELKKSFWSILAYKISITSAQYYIFLKCMLLNTFLKRFISVKRSRLGNFHIKIDNTNKTTRGVKSENLDS